MSLIRRPGILAVTLLFVLVGAAFLTQVVPYRQIITSNRQVSEAEQTLSAIQAENARLEADVSALNTEEEVERLARQKLGYVRPGEVAYVVLEPPGADQTESASDEGPVEPPPTWVDRVWYFLSGRDLETNG
jgi:cell division protein FtsB